jgi:hypothetical protein
MRNWVKSINAEFKEKTIDLLQSQRSQLINHLTTHREEYLKLNVLRRHAVISDYVASLSFFTDEEVKDVIKSLGLLKYTPKVFVCHLDFFKSLDEFQEKAKYLYLYETIWGIYESYSLCVIKEKMALDYSIDLSENAGIVNRQRNNKSFPPILDEVVEDTKIIFDFVKKEVPYFKMNISDKNPFTSMTHQIKYSHKYELYYLYHGLADFNKETGFIDFNESDFKVEFYDLLEIVLREKELLNNSEEAISNYETLRRFKIKRVERLILS